MNTKIKRHEVWRKQYRNKRYLEHISDEDLHTRIDDVFRNSLILTNDGKISLRPISSEGEYWMIMWTHILEEVEIRGNGIPEDLLSPETIPLPTWPKAPNAAAALEGRDFNNKDYLFKYGNEEYLKNMYEKGDLRVSPATRYNDSSLNSAINDDERMLSIFLNPKETKLTHYSKTGTASELTPIGNIKATYEVSTNYYAYCMAHVYDYRLFDDFKYDVCIVIKDVDKFVYSINNAVTKLVGNYPFSIEEVRYVDPLNPPHDKDIDVFFCKHFRYTYQKEVRIVWLPDNPVMNLDDLYINIGPMDEYAEYIKL